MRLLLAADHLELHLDTQGSGSVETAFCVSHFELHDQLAMEFMLFPAFGQPSLLIFGGATGMSPVGVRHCVSTLRKVAHVVERIRGVVLCVNPSWHKF